MGTLDNVVITGTDAPGFSPATVYRGSITYAGTLEIEIGGLAAGSFDAIVHSGTASLGGILDVSLINGFTPNLGDTFQFLTASSRAGEFGTVVGADLGGGLLFDVLYSASSVTLEVVQAGISGDYNNNGIVDAADYTVWRDNLGTTNTLPNDPIGGTIGTAHYNQWTNNFGATPSNSNTVPEPSTLLLGILAGWQLATGRSRRSRYAA